MGSRRRNACKKHSLPRAAGVSPPVSRQLPIGIDAHEAGQDFPLTMHAYRMYGTLTLIFIDRFGIVRYHVFVSTG